MDDVNTMITGASAVVYIIALAVGIFQLVCMWMTFKKQDAKDGQL